MLAFQLPWLPETLLRPGLPAVLRRSGLPEEDVRRYAARFRQPGAATPAMNWYRGAPITDSAVRLVRGALGRGLGVLGRGVLGRGDDARAAAGERARPHRITVPTTYVWGSADPALGRDAARRTERWVASDYRFVEVPAGHWLPETEPALVAQEIIARAT
jgi:pimeloyl-ACP methyl ester carboxylesterase